MKTKYLFILLLLSNISIQFLSCDESTKPETVTFSGIVILEGETDHSNAKVMLFRPMEIDTALTNLNVRYPGIGIELNQRTEFYWREHNPEYQTKTNSAGAWKIEEINPGNYHIVAIADSFGWKVIYNANEINNDIILKKAIIWNGFYSQSQTLPASSFVQVEGNTTFQNGTNLTIEAGSIIEFRNNSILEVNDQLTINGVSGNEVYFVSQDTMNTSQLRLIESNNALLNIVCFFYIKNGIYFKSSNFVVIQKCKFENAQYALDLFDCIESMISNNIINNMQNGITMQRSSVNINKNQFINISNHGVQSGGEGNLQLRYNVIKNCGNYGLMTNPFGVSGITSTIDIFNNDFVNNSNHIFVGRHADVKANYNNYIDETDYIVNTTTEDDIDTVNFKHNYWDYISPIEISNKIFDRLDRTSGERGPIVEYSEFKLSYITWKDSL